MFEELTHGEQAIVGFIKEPNKDLKFVKIARSLDFLMEHEYLLGKELNKLSHIKNHFVNVHEMIKVYTPPINRITNGDEILLSRVDKCIPRKALVMDYIKNGKVLTEYLASNKTAEFRYKELYPLICHVLLIVRMAQEAIDFTHYDLHTDNVILIPNTTHCDYVYKFKNGDTYRVKASSMIPIIIDYGRSYCNVLRKTRLSVELFHTHVGIFTVQPHPNFDYLFFLNSCGIELPTLAHKLRPFTRHLDEFGWWDNTKDVSAFDRACSPIKQIAGTISVLFAKRLEQSIIILSHMCRLPFGATPKHNPAVYWPYYFKRFLQQWVYLERWFKEVPRMAYCLIDLVYILNNYKTAYCTPETQATTLTAIIHDVTQFMDTECGDVWIAGNLNWSELVHCAYKCSTMLESLCCDIIAKQYTQFYTLVGHIGFDKLYAVVDTKPEIDEAAAHVVVNVTH